MPVVRPEPDALTAKEVCDLLHIGRTTLQRRIAEGLITPINADFNRQVKARQGRLRFRRADVEKLAQSSDAS